MSEYMEKHTVSRLFGSRPVTSGTRRAPADEKVRRKPFVVLFDEIGRLTRISSTRCCRSREAA